MKRHTMTIALVACCLMWAGCLRLETALIHSERGTQYIIQAGEGHAVSNPKNKTDAGKTFEDAFKGDPTVDVGGF